MPAFKYNQFISIYFCSGDANASDLGFHGEGFGVSDNQR